MSVHSILSKINGTIFACSARTDFLPRVPTREIYNEVVKAY
ncbi:hypothetical protein F441_02470 [Phytophthora nicotianae CJ01A1]|uniref:Uncharacterized protein n=5 Tax=Phytophthora nicotianae TaxID=4792 RepID=W2QPX0_PHYN3|nr:hypothetical protein PPTG_22085 [Phytophthora nicotianae INRA-310]ETK94600.1 hypothetical protein L915_02405 [Phytophthora nicotianae]ETO83497.1 hypothetical protein F444_02521 [Phytophthora nicotianae P1976]ETP24585.1 hypothetical protein F441_02470 [Phytophthora nicotianae CJ01A1]ETP52524.1 hypothetical protein F442_02501 [Phytophthora nicotianae P10297]ETL47975.1 hypothetical protein L916_02379 [Phytophthora nicotianae]